MPIYEEIDNVIVASDSYQDININDSEDTLFVTEEQADVSVDVSYPINPIVSDNPETVSVQEITDVVHEITDALSIYQNTTTIVNNYTVEDEMPLDKEIDFVGETIIYKGLAEPNSLTSDPVWLISRIEFIGEDINTKFAGTGLFDQIWDDRAALSY